MSNTGFVKNIRSGRIFPASPLLDPKVCVPCDPESGELTAAIPPRGVTRSKAPDPPEKADAPIQAPSQELPSASTDLNDLHWTQLRKKVLEAGGKYTNREDAINFLNSTEVPV